jgi:hypothetical protein
LSKKKAREKAKARRENKASGGERRRQPGVRNCGIEGFRGKKALNISDI